MSEHQQRFPFEPAPAPTNSRRGFTFREAGPSDPDLVVINQAAALGLEWTVSRPKLNGDPFGLCGLCGKRPGRRIRFHVRSSRPQLVCDRCAPAEDRHTTDEQQRLTQAAQTRQGG